MRASVQIDFVSDVACPWCIIGLKALDQALLNLKDEVQAQIHFQPFELNPNMPAEGQDITEHLTEKYGISAAQAQANRENIRVRGAQLGFVFTRADEPGGGRNRVNNTFDAHRLLHWAQVEHPTLQKALKEALFKALFTEGKNVAAHEVLIEIAGAVGLEKPRARAILASDEFAQAVREREQFYLQAGIHSVPAIIINQKHLISGGQPVAVFEQALRQVSQSG